MTSGVPETGDPFGTEALRAEVLRSWAASPTRLREDAAVEADLATIGYRDRVVTELVQNAADAAVAAGVDGRVVVTLDRDHGGRPVLHVANTGVPLDTRGVHALASLRASVKGRDPVPGDGGEVGRFGVGFTSVLSVSDRIEVRSRAGSVLFSRALTAEAWARRAPVSGDVTLPALRLPFPLDAPPAEGSDTEVVLTLLPGVDGERLLDEFADRATDLLLELPAVAELVVGGRTWTAHRTPPDPETGLAGVSIGERRWLESRADGVRWLVPVRDGTAVPVDGDTLRAPTPSDELLSLPALVIADIPMQPDRRHVMPGSPIERLASGFAQLVAGLPPGERIRMVPRPGFARGDVDHRLREAVHRSLLDERWVPTTHGPDVRPGAAVVVPGLTTDLATVLDDLVANLVPPELSTRESLAALESVDVRRYGLARIAEVLTGVERPPAWWRRLYAALEPLVVDQLAVEELAAIPVPLSDGRTVTGPRTAVLVDGLPSDLPPLSWLRAVDPDAAHPLLARLGATVASAADLLEDPQLGGAVLEADPDEPEQATALFDCVLALVAAGGPGAVLPDWVGELLLPDTTGEFRAADELLLPGAPLAAVLVADAPLATVAHDVVDRFGPAALRRVGVGWGFTILRADLPTGPDHDLDDEDRWWDGLDEEPDVLLAVRDLDLVDDRRWAAALSLLAGDAGREDTCREDTCREDTVPDVAGRESGRAEGTDLRAALRDRNGYTCWWLRRHARIDGLPLGAYRARDDAFGGLLDELPHPAAAELAGTLAGSRVESARLARLLIDRLADPDRSPSPGQIADAYRLLGDAVAEGRLDLDDIPTPQNVRTIAGGVIPAASALVVDRPWLTAVVPPERMVLGSLPTARGLAELLDVRLASEAITGEVTSRGRDSEWGREPGAVLAAAALGVPLPSGRVTVHERLLVRVHDSSQCDTGTDGTRTEDMGTGGMREREVPYWMDRAGQVHVCGEWTRAVAAASRPASGGA